MLCVQSGYMTFHLIQFQPLPFQPLTISTHCIFNLRQFRPVLILAIYSEFGQVIISQQYLVINQSALIIGTYS